MPIYEYKCLTCGKIFEITQKITAKPITKCPECGGDVKKLISNSSSFILKGSGWYATDYARKDNKEPKKPIETKSKPETKKANTA